MTKIEFSYNIAIMKRNIDPILKDFVGDSSENSRVLLVEGARQVGKTYLVESVLKELPPERVVSINLEREKDLKLEIDGTKNFGEFTGWLSLKKGFKNNAGYTVFIDEAQESRILGSYVLSMKEEWKKTRVILTGSSMNRLFDGSTRVPVGRIEYLTVWPFTFLEFLKFGKCEREMELIQNFNLDNEIYDAVHKQMLGKYDEYLSVGGMPEAVRTFYEGKEYAQTLRFIIASQQDDFQRKESHLKNNLFLDAIKAVSNGVGYPFKKTHISKNDYDASAVLALLKQWYIVLEVAQKGSATTQDNFHPKEYLYDLGILKILRETVIPKISAVKTLNEKLRSPLGGLIENAVLLNMLEGKGGFYEINGWKNRSNKEIDFIYPSEQSEREGEAPTALPLEGATRAPIKDSENISPIEVKASLNVTNRHAKNLIQYLLEHDLKTGLLISLDKPKRMNLRGLNIINIPAYLFSQNFLKIVL